MVDELQVGCWLGPGGACWVWAPDCLLVRPLAARVVHLGPTPDPGVRAPAQAFAEQKKAEAAQLAEALEVRMTCATVIVGGRRCPSSIPHDLLVSWHVRLPSLPTPAFPPFPSLTPTDDPPRHPQGANAGQRELGSRLRASEALLAEAQAAAAAAASRVERAERRAAALGEELAALRQMHDALQSEHTGACGQLAATQTGHELAMRQIADLAAQLATARAEAVRRAGSSVRFLFGREVGCGGAAE